MTTVIRLTIITVLFGYVFIGLLGYATFANNLDVLFDSEKSNGIILIAYGYNLLGGKRAYPTLVVIVRIFLRQLFLLDEEHDNSSNVDNHITTF